MGTVVFDLDGTLADTSGDLIAAANFVFRADGYGDLLDPVTDGSTAFRGARAMLRLGYQRAGHPDADAQIERRYPDVLEAYGAALHISTQLYPGAAEAVSALRRRGYTTAICTNKPENLSKKLLESLEFLHLFDALVGADTLHVRKPDPRPIREAIRRAGGEADRAILIGDTENDREAARAAGIPCMLVTFGPDGHDVADLAPEGLLHHFDHLPDLVEEWIERPVGN